MAKQVYRLSSTRAGIALKQWPYSRPAPVHGSSSAFSSKAAEIGQNINKSDTEWIKAKPFKSIPGPGLLELIRWFLPGGVLYDKPMSQMMFHMEQTYGTVCRMPAVFGRPPMVFTFDPLLSERIYRDEGAWPIRRGIDTFEYYRRMVRPDVFKDLSGLLADQGETWHKLRTKVNPVMLQTRTVKSYVKPVDAVARDFVHKIGVLRDQNDELPDDFATELSAWAFESISVIALDRRLGAMSFDKVEETHAMIQAVKRILELTFELDVQPSIWRIFSTKRFRELMANYDIMTNMVMKHIDASIADYKNQNADSTPHGEESVLQKLLKIDRHYATVMTFDMLLAGIDTTGNSVTNLLYLLAMNPEKQEILRAEVFELLPTIDSEINQHSLDHSPYFRGALKESMRMQAISTGNLRGAGQDMVLDGYQIPKNTDIVMGNVVLTASDKYFTNSAEFQPERFMRDANGNYPPSPKDHSSFSFLPFGFGSRMCIGKRFAELEIQLLVFRILREYRVEWHHAPMKYGNSLFMSATSPLRYRMVRLSQ